METAESIASLLKRNRYDPALISQLEGMYDLIFRTQYGFRRCISNF
jgi:hypothetical protein